MKKANIIRKIIAGIFLLLFAFSITPKNLLHDVLANHKDLPFQQVKGLQPIFQQAGFYCHCENLVVESPFTCAFHPVVFSPVLGYFENLASPLNNLHSARAIYASLSRPPPGAVGI